MLTDLRHAIRLLYRAPSSAAIAILTLALGIGANTAIFSIINGVLLKPLPYRDAARIARLNEGRPNFQLNVSYPNFLDWRVRARSFEGMAIYNPYGRTIVAANGRSEAAPAGTTEARLFTLLGVQPVLGRVFTPEEEKPGAPAVVLISHGLWLRQFGGATTALGRTLSTGSPAVIVGVLPAWFTLQNIDVWWPLAPTIGAMQLDRGNHPGFQVFARLRDGITFERAQQEMSGIAEDLERQYPVTNRQMGVFVRPFLESMVSRVRPMLWLLGGAVGFLLLIACANVANVLLARGLRRQRETAVRVALGATRSRIVRLFLSESLAVGLLGGAGGVLAAAWGVRACLRLPSLALPRTSEIAVDGRVLVYAVALSVLTSVLFGLAPALHLSRIRFVDPLRQSGPAGLGGSGGLRAALIAIEVALSLTLLVGAGLMLRTLVRLAAVDPGYRPEGLLTLNTQQPSSTYDDDDARRRFADRVLSDLRAAPGVSAAAFAWPMDQVSFSWSPYANFLDRPFERGHEPLVQLAAVTPTYFATMEIPVRRGRVFGPQDRPGAPRAAIVNETVVRRFLPAGDPIGRHMSIVAVPELADLEIIGVVGDTLRSGPTGRATAEVYCAYAQFPASHPTLVVRSATGDPLQLVRTVQDQMNAVDGAVASYGARRLVDAVASTVGDRRLLSGLLSMFAALALALTALGIAGVVSFVAAQRTQEIAIRIALGARPGAVIRTAVGWTLTAVVVGLVIGFAMALPLTRLIQRFLFEVIPWDPLSLGLGAALMIIVALGAAYVPARRAARANPITALRRT